MKKMFVILLILAVAGGAIAEESRWSIEGSGELVTTMDFLPDIDLEYTDIRMGGQALVGFGLTFGYERSSRQGGIWTVNVPLTIEANIREHADGDVGRFGTSGASIGYNRGPLTVNIPFDFDVRRQSEFYFAEYRYFDFEYDEDDGWSWDRVDEGDGAPMFWPGSEGYGLIRWGNAGIRATYAETNYWFTLGIDNIIRADYDDDFITVGATGGWYQFGIGAGATLAVSYKGAVETPWFRSSDVSFRGFGFYPWENIGKELGDSDDGEEGVFADGIAFRIFVAPGFSLGFAFANHAMFTDRAVNTENFGGNELNDGTNFHLSHDFLLNGVFGAKYEARDWEVALMAGWTNYWTHPWGPGFGFPKGFPMDDESLGEDAAVDWTSDDYFYHVSIPVYLGGIYRINSDFSVGADMSGRFLFTGPTDEVLPWEFPFVSTPVFNVGAFLAYGAPANNGFWARAEVYALELGLPLVYEDGAEFTFDDYPDDLLAELDGGNSPRVFRPYSWDTRTLGLELMVGFNGTWADGWTNNGDGPWGGLWVKFGNFFAFESFDGGVELRAGVGYNNFRFLDQLALNANAFVHSKILGTGTDIGFRVTPEIVWSLIPRGSITFGYNIGYNWHMGDNRLRSGGEWDNTAGEWLADNDDGINSVLFCDEWFGLQKEGRLTQHTFDITFKWSF